VTRAREGHKAKLIQVVLEAAHQDARHAEWLLERQFPAEFGRTEPPTIVIERLPPVPSPAEPEPRSRTETEKWFTKSGKGIPLDKEALNYLASLRRDV